MLFMARPKPTPEQMAKKVSHFRRVIKFRSYFGWMFAIVGGALFGVGVKNNQMPLIMINGALFFRIWSLYGLAEQACPSATGPRGKLNIFN